MSEGSVYILGQMRGIKYYNFLEFDRERNRLQKLGYTVCSPADIDREEGFDALDLPHDSDWNNLPKNLSMPTIIRRDVLAILDKCDKYVALDGWQNSTGARAEKALLDWMGAEWLNKPASESICQEGHRLTREDRNNAYGHPLDNFGLTVNLINARFGTQFKAEDFAEIMILAKIARQARASKRDNMVDIAGYANTHQMVIDERNARNHMEFLSLMHNGV